MARARIKVRPIKDTDRDFVINAWLMAHRNSSECVRQSNPTYYSNQEPLIQRLLDVATTLVATADDDDDQLAGFITFQHIDGVPVVHYFFVKNLFRRRGIARELFAAANINPALPLVYTHLTHKSLAKDYMYTAKHNPYLLLDYRR